MRTILTNFFRLQAQNVEALVLIGLGGIYLVILITTLSSIWSRPKGLLFKLAWSVLSVTAPFAGMALYACQCIWQSDRSFFHQLGVFKRNTKC